MRLFRDITVALLAGMIVAFLFRSAAFATYFIPSESMVPTLQVGDHLAVSKFAYGWGRYSFTGSIPFQLNGRILGSLPERGDVVVFAHPHDGRTMIKRVVGLPGDQIQISGGRLIINGVTIKRDMVDRYRYRQFEGGVAAVTRYIETLPNGREYSIVQESDDGLIDNTPAYPVPAGKLFMLGDNRDNSADSRFASMGYVPVENLIGRADTILFSRYSCEAEQGLLCATPRALAAIE
jgi:signal peptidase I